MVSLSACRLMRSASALALDAPCTAAQMIVDGVDDFFSCGIDFVALLGFGLLHLGLRVELGTRFLAGTSCCPTCSAARF